MKISILIFTICPPRIELLPPPLTYNVDKINSMKEVIMTYLPTFDDPVFKFAPALIAYLFNHDYFFWLGRRNFSRKKVFSPNMVITWFNVKSGKLIFE